MRSPSCFFSSDRGNFPGPDVARGRNTLFRPVPFPSIRRPSWPGEGSLERRMRVFEGTYPRRHGETMQTPHRKALSLTPPRRTEHTASRTHSIPSGNPGPGPSSCEATALPTMPPCPSPWLSLNQLRMCQRLLMPVGLLVCQINMRPSTKPQVRPGMQ